MHQSVWMRMGVCVLLTAAWMHPLNVSAECPSPDEYELTVYLLNGKVPTGLYIHSFIHSFNQSQ